MSGVSTSGELIWGSVELCTDIYQSLNTSREKMQIKLRDAGHDWKDSKYKQLEDIVNGCDSSIKRTMQELNGCLATLYKIAQIVEEYEGINLSGSSVSPIDNSGYGGFVSQSNLQEAIGTGYENNPFDENGALRPNITYFSGEHDYRYTTDGSGRITGFQTDNLAIKTHTGRLPHESGTPDRLTTDHAGHLFADLFGGSPGLENMISQDSILNQGSYRSMESDWATALRNGSTVAVEGEVFYSDDSHRPSVLRVTYAIDGNCFVEFFTNGGNHNGF